MQMMQEQIVAGNDDMIAANSSRQNTTEAKWRETNVAASFV